MSRWAPDARARLERAAVELFVAQGFGPTTVPQITARAGLTTRTFFRHFADKREVLFGGDEIPELAARLLAETPLELDAMTLVAQGLQRVAVLRFDGRRASVRTVRGLIRSDDGLRERDLRKRAALAEVVRSGLEARGEHPLAAAVAADVAVSVLHIALERWVDAEHDGPLGPVLAEVLDEYGALVGRTAPREPVLPSAAADRP